MSNSCFTPIRGRRMRVTRVDALGRPVPGPCSTVVSKGFVKVDMKAEIEAGEETTLRTAGGDICVSERGADALKWIETTVEFCQVDPDLFSMINPTWTKLVDHRGETIGWEESHSYSIDVGVALEVWSDVSGYVSTDPTAQGAWVYYLLPQLVGGTLGDMSIENGAVTFSITARTKKGSQWGRGPYPVMGNPPDGACGRMITPFSTEAPRRIFLTGCPPPEALCGCQPLSHPDGPQVDVYEDITDTTRMTVHAAVTGAGPFTVSWGDGTTENLASGLTGLSHTYGAVGDYTVSIYPTASPTQATFTRVSLPYTGAVPGSQLRAFVSEDTTDLTRMKAKAEWTNVGFGTVRVDWGDGTTAATAQAETGNATHVYSTPGTYTVMVTDESDATRKVTRQIIVPFGILLNVGSDQSDTDGRTVQVTVQNSGFGSVSLNWGDGTATVTNPGNGTTVSSHKYAAAGAYTITATDSDQSTRSATKLVTLPFPTVAITQYLTDTKKMSVALVVNNHGNGAVTIDWGDATSTSTNAGDNTAVTTHKYAEDGTYTITVTDSDNSAIVVKRTASVPYSGGLAMTMSVVESSPPGSPRRKVTLTWDNQDQGPVKIKWGEPPTGETPVDGAVSGTLDHTYAASGTYTVTVTDATNPARVQTQNVTVPFV